MHCSTARFRFGETMAQTQLTWYGQSGFKIVTPSGKTLLIDPWLTNPVFEKGKDTLAALKDVDLILLSHGHSDHVGNTVEIGKKTGAKLVANFDLSGAVTSVLGYPSEQAESDTTGHIGGQLILLNGELTVCFVPAWHGSSVRKNENSAPVYSGMPTGLVICIRNGPTIYHTGDTGFFSDIARVSDYNKIDIFQRGQLVFAFFENWICQPWVDQERFSDRSNNFETGLPIRHCFTKTKRGG